MVEIRWNFGQNSSLSSFSSVKNFSTFNWNGTAKHEIYINTIHHNTYCVYKLWKHRSVIKQNESDLNTNQVTPTNWKFHEHPKYSIYPNRNPTNQPGPLRTQKKPSFGSGDSRPTSRSSLSLSSQIRVSPATKVLQKVNWLTGRLSDFDSFSAWLPNRENIDHARKGL